MTLPSVSRKATYTIGSFFILGLLVSCVNAYVETKAELHDRAMLNAQQAIASFEQSKADYCSVFRAYLSACDGGRKTKACNTLEDVKTEYWDIYETEAQDDCMKIVHEDGAIENIETEVAYPDDVAPISHGTDPMFFDDSVMQ